MICVLAGGVGAARLLNGLKDVLPSEEITAVINTGDDAIMHGLYICPDIDTVTYTLAGVNNVETGWGLQGETWVAMESLKKLGGETWFNLGDKDLATHLYRTARLSEGVGLKEITKEIASAMGISVNLLPMTEDRVETMVTLLESGDEISFQEYFVKHRHEVPISSVRFNGSKEAQAAHGVIDAIREAEVVIIAPSNPLVSIAPIFSIPEISNALKERKEDVVAVSPIVAGSALKGPADRLLNELGYEASVEGVAKYYQDWINTLIIDKADFDSVENIESLGINCVSTETVMSDPQIAASLGSTLLGLKR
ncbi:MAG: 2-phospho-L-lactate transferase [Acidimicrobiales bacterium]|nr:2-phospho-L-lactate transferase [Acidimicrobiales bacterium]